MNVKLSIIIPCYNSQSTLEETLVSVVDQEFQEWEALIINDGSTDLTEEIALKWVKKDIRIKYYSKQNEGLCKTRNFGIDKAKGVYILPLDSDNMILNDFTKEAVALLDKNDEIGVIHGNAEFFGEKTGLWEIGDFSLEKMLLVNYIDACAVFRKKYWKEVGGYDENLPFKGLEDWELWLAFGAINVVFYHLKKVTFRYRVSRHSMIGVFTKEMAEGTSEYIAKKYSSLYRYHFSKYYSEYVTLSNKQRSKKYVINSFCKLFFGKTIFQAK
ncbi:glycosyltransferase family 2 protein [Tamlana sp. s12]|uniref:glycosyltransferase family 2 protein n=1 Tax=Tamlana sp. s12 TaxID=1630406 RepID=UPI0008381F02|nr:glycosyltransferase family A protein [Tamlana sp. s12]QQY80924.1 glycosyltransferase family 2 protein [Tamlana sp. s12]